MARQHRTGDNNELTTLNLHTQQIMLLVNHANHSLQRVSLKALPYTIQKGKHNKKQPKKKNFYIAWGVKLWQT